MSDVPTDAHTLEKLVDLTRDARFVMLTTLDADGAPVSRPMTRQDMDLDADLWFIATRDSRKVAQLAADARASVTVSAATSWVSLTGTAEVVDDVDRLREYWSTFAEAWIPDGPEDPNAILVHFSAESAEYWDSPGGRVATVVSMVKSKVTGEPYDGGDHGTVSGL